MGTRVDRLKEYFWQVAVVAAIPAILGLAVMLKPAPLPDNDRPFWSDDDHLKTCPTCRSGLSEFNALPTSTLDGQRDVAQDGSSTPTAAWRNEAAIDTRASLDG